MHVGKQCLQQVLTSHIHWWRCSGLPLLAAADVVVHRRNVENARYVLVNFYDFLHILTHGPLSRKAGTSYSAMCRYIDPNEFLVY